MKTEINLLQQQKSTQKKRSAFFKLCLFLLMLTIAVTVGEIAYSYYIRTRISSLASDQSATLSQIEALDAKRVKFQTLKERLLSIGKILPESEKFNTRVQSIFSFIPSGMEVVNVDASAKEISLTVSSASLSTINDFLGEGVKSILSDKSLGIVSSEVSSVGRGIGGYSAEVTFVF